VRARNIEILVEKFDTLSDDMVVDKRVTARILGTSPSTIDRNQLLPEIQISERFKGNRVGDIRKLARGGAASA
jgi:hypothetical protein